MASIDKTSVREEFDRLKTDFKQLNADGKLAKDVKILMQSMFLLFELILSIFLEKKTTKNNKNSNKPSSQTDKDETAASQGSNGKGKKENNDTADNTRTIETVTIAKVFSCNTCGEDLTNTPTCGCERRTKIDIIFEKTVEHVDAEIKRCPSCETETKGVFPVDMTGSLQYGNGLKAYIINLIVCQMVALNRVQKMVKSIIGVVISEATLLKYVLRLNQALADWEASAIRQILKASAINVDETSIRVNKKNHWIHVYSAGDITLKFLHSKRGKKAIEDINIIPVIVGLLFTTVGLLICRITTVPMGYAAHIYCASSLLPLRQMTMPGLLI